MSHVRDPSPIDRAKELDLSDFFMNEMNAKTSPPSSTRHRKSFGTCPKCGPSTKSAQRVSICNGGRTWKCWVCQETGSIIDAAMLYWSCSVRDAALGLLGESEKQFTARKFPVRQASEERVVDSADLRQAIQRIAQITAPEESNCMRFLVEDRGIPASIIHEARARGMVGFLPSDPVECTRMFEKHVGRDLMEKANLWHKDKSRPAIAYRPICFFLPGGNSAEFRVIGKAVGDSPKGIRYGALKYPWFWQGVQPQCLVVEGFIDLMSAIAMDWQGHIIGLPGVGNYGRREWWTAAWSRYNLKRWVIGLDNDAEKPPEKNAGQITAGKLELLYQELGMPFTRFVPPAGDLNDILKSRCRPIAAATGVAA